MCSGDDGSVGLEEAVSGGWDELLGTLGLADMDDVGERAECSIRQDWNRDRSGQSVRTVIS